MHKRLAYLISLAVLTSTLAVSSPASAAPHRADAWIKLCGLSNGCSIDPPPHPWKGRNVVNTTAARQTVAVRLEDGEGVRFWVTIENDGERADTFTLDGCRGNRHFVINAVLMGKHKDPNWRARNITRQFRNDTASFSLPPGRSKVFTLNIIAATHTEGISYRCEMTFRSEARWAARDAVAARMTTF